MLRKKIIHTLFVNVNLSSYLCVMDNNTDNNTASYYQDVYLKGLHKIAVQIHKGLLKAGVSNKDIADQSDAYVDAAITDAIHNSMLELIVGSTVNQQILASHDKGTDMYEKILDSMRFSCVRTIRYTFTKRIELVAAIEAAKQTLATFDN